MNVPARLDHVGVEAAAQAAVGGDHDQQRLAARARHRAFVEQRMRPGSTRDARLFSTRSICVANGRACWIALLRAAQPRRRDHLHRLGDLLRRLDRADAAPDVDKRRHGRSLWRRRSSARPRSPSPNSSSAAFSSALICVVDLLLLGERRQQLRLARVEELVELALRRRERPRPAPGRGSRWSRRR